MQYKIPFELTQRIFKYSIESNERCRTTSPNTSDEVKAKGECEVQDEVTPMLDEVTPMSSGKFVGNEIIEDELMASG